MRKQTVTTAAATLIALLTITGCGETDKTVWPSGTLEATEVDLTPALAGKVLEVRADQGDRVSNNDTLLILDTELIRLQREQTAKGLQAVYANRAAATDRLLQAEQSLALAEKTLARLERLADEGSITQQQLDEARTQRDIAAGNVSAAKNAIRAIDAEGGKLEAALDVFDRQLEDGVLVAPSSGTVLLSTLEPGEMASPAGVAFRLADLESLELRVYVDEKDVDLVKLGQKVEVKVDALPDQTLTGTVTWVSPEAEFTPKNVQTRNARAQLVYAVKLELENPDGRLHIGMPAEADIGGDSQ